MRRFHPTGDQGGVFGDLNAATLGQGKLVSDQCLVGRPARNSVYVNLSSMVEGKEDISIVNKMKLLVLTLEALMGHTGVANPLWTMGTPANCRNC